MYTIYGLICLGLVYILSTAFRARQTKVPGPWYTNFTDLVLRYHEFNGHRRIWIHKLHTIYGPVVRLAPNEVAFANLEGMKEIYQSGGSGYDKTEFYDLFTQYGHRPMFTLLHKNEHGQRRRLFADRYAMTNILSSSIMEGIRENVAKVSQKCTASSGSYLDIYRVLHYFALDCASHALFNPGGTKSLDEGKDVVFYEDLSYDNRLQARLIQLNFPILHSILTLFAPKPTLSVSQKFVLDRVLHSKPLESSLLYRLRTRSEQLEEMVMAAESMDHMFAGIDTTGDALCFLMYELSLSRSKYVQKRLYEEFTQNPDAKFDELPYLDAVIKEGLRLFPPIPMSLPRYVPQEGRTISGYKLPGGSIVSCQAWSMHLMDNTVFPNPLEFSPERWLQKEGKAERNRLFFAFASGGRGCIGKNLALVEMKMLLREIYGTFTTSIPPEMKSDMSIDDQIIASRPKDQKCLLEFKRWPVD